MKIWDGGPGSQRPFLDLSDKTMSKFLFVFLLIFESQINFYGKTKKLLEASWSAKGFCISLYEIDVPFVSELSVVRMTML